MTSRGSWIRLEKWAASIFGEFSRSVRIAPLLMGDDNVLVRL